MRRRRRKRAVLRTGLATYRKGHLYFDNRGWALVLAHARKDHKTPRQIVIGALKRGIKRGAFEKAKEDKSKKAVESKRVHLRRAKADIPLVPRAQKSTKRGRA